MRYLRWEWKMLGPRFGVAVSALVILLAGGEAVCQKGISRAWQRINAEGAFTFSLPPGMKKTDMTGVESFLGEYLDGERRFLFVHEPYSYTAYDSRRSDEMKDYRETESMIGCRKADVRTYYTVEKGRRTYVGELYVGDWAASKVELFMTWESRDPADLAVARRIFNSVKFPKDKGTHNKGCAPGR